MFEKLISTLARLLSENKIPYMLIGGQAVLLYGVPRLTKDIDITLGISTDRLTDVVKVCHSAKLKILPKDYKDFVEKTFVLPVKDEITGIRVDFIFSFTPYEQQAIERAKKVTIGNIAINFASVEDVIIHKIFAGRPRDIEDVKNIIVKNPVIDINYIKRYLLEFDKTVEGAKFIDSFKQIMNDIT